MCFNSFDAIYRLPWNTFIDFENPFFIILCSLQQSIEAIHFSLLFWWWNEIDSSIILERVDVLTLSKSAQHCPFFYSICNSIWEHMRTCTVCYKTFKQEKFFADAEFETAFINVKLQQNKWFHVRWTHWTFELSFSHFYVTLHVWVIHVICSNKFTTNRYILSFIPELTSFLRIIIIKTFHP